MQGLGLKSARSEQGARAQLSHLRFLFLSFLLLLLSIHSHLLLSPSQLSSLLNALFPLPSLALLPSLPVTFLSCFDFLSFLVFVTFLLYLPSILFPNRSWTLVRDPSPALGLRGSWGAEKGTVFKVLRDNAKLVEIQDERGRCYTGRGHRGFGESTIGAPDSGWGLDKGWERGGCLRWVLENAGG